MNILALSLLRIGDLFIQAPALRLIKEAFPESRLDILVNHHVRGIEEVFPYIDDFIEIDRDVLQQGLGETDINPLSAILQLRRSLENLSRRDYGTVYNLTHNRYSAAIATGVRPKMIVGLYWGDQGYRVGGTHWLKYLNHSESSLFHYSDVFQRSILAQRIPPKAFHAPKKFCNPRGSRPITIAIQTKTSDSKKEWPASYFQEAVTLLSRALDGGAEFLVLSGPSEEKVNQLLVDQLTHSGVPVQHVAAPFNELAGILKSVQLLITGDTSVKHLGAGVGVPTIEIALGGSRPEHTGAYAEGALVLRSSELCHPCEHSQSCFHSRHYCGDRVSPQYVADVAKIVLTGERHLLPGIAERFRLEGSLSEVFFDSTGLWTERSLSNRPVRPDILSKFIDRRVWQVLLDEEARRSSRSLEDTALSLRNDLGRLASEGMPENLHRFFEWERSRLSSDTAQPTDWINLKTDIMEICLDLGGIHGERYERANREISG